jgi:hypothetical protein
VTICFEHVAQAALFTVAKQLGSLVVDLADTAKYGFVLGLLASKKVLKLV